MIGQGTPLWANSAPDAGEAAAAEVELELGVRDHQHTEADPADEEPEVPAGADEGLDGASVDGGRSRSGILEIRLVDAQNSSEGRESRTGGRITWT